MKKQLGKHPALSLRASILLIIFIGFLLYARGLTNTFVGDDSLQIVRNESVHELKNIPQFFMSSTYENAGADNIHGIFYRPLMMITFTLIYSLSGPNPFLFHLTSLLFHIANTILLFLFLRKFFKDNFSFLISLTFLVHPINSEVVLYSANMQEVLYVFFGLSALLVIQHTRYSTKKVATIAGFLLLSLLAKESGILFLTMATTYEILFTTNAKEKKKFFFLLPVVGGMYLFLRYSLAHMQHANTSIAPIAHLPLFERAINIPAIIFHYLHMFFNPLHMSVDQQWIVKAISFREFWLPSFLIVFLAMLLFAGYSWVKKTNAKFGIILLFFILWFLAGLLLHLQIIPLDATVADRWFYFPIIGLLGTLGVLTNMLIAKKKLPQNLVAGVLLVIIVFFSVRTFVRIGDWTNELTLYAHDTTEQQNFILYDAYGTALIDNSDFEKAKPYIIASVNEHPYSSNLNNLAIIYVSEKKLIEAKKTFEQAIASGKNFSVYENYANFLLYYENPKDAITFTLKALDVFPKSTLLWLVLAKAAYLSGNKHEALRGVTTAYKLEPNETTQTLLNIIKNGKKLQLNYQ